MNHFSKRLLLGLTAALSLAPANFCRGGSGDVDRGFRPVMIGTVATVALQPDGKILAGGDFRVSSGSITQSILARLDVDGGVDPGFRPSISGFVRCVAVQDDGKILIGGVIYSVNGLSRLNLARLNSDGTLDLTFEATNWSGAINAIAVQPNEKIIVAGEFTAASGVARNRIARLDAKGLLDPAFNPNLLATANSVRVLADGELLVAGQGVKRLNAIGTVDSHFIPGVSGTVETLAANPDGTITIGGGFTSVNGSANSGLARLTSFGGTDSLFRAPAMKNPSLQTASVYSLQPTVSGDVIAAGNFVKGEVSGVAMARHGLAKLSSNGALDASFDPQINFAETNTALQGLTLQPNGAALIAGNFDSLGATVTSGSFVPQGAIFQPSLARLDVGAAADGLTVADFGQIIWSRWGNAPEVESAQFSLSTDGGREWRPLGPGVRQGMGWKISGLLLPAKGEVRVRARFSCGFRNGSSSLIEKAAPFGGAVPVLSVLDESGRKLPLAGEAVAFPNTPRQSAGASVRQIRLQNTGDASLGLGSITVDGADAAAFLPDRTELPGRLLPGQAAVLRIRFAPSLPGKHMAQLRMQADGAGRAGLVFDLTGIGIASTQADLADLNLAVGEITPAFTPATLSYTASVSRTASTVKLLGTVAHANARAVVSGRPQQASAFAETLAVAHGPNAFLIEVTAEDAATRKTYTIVVNREGTDANDVDPEFGKKVAAQSASIYALAELPDRRVVLGGSFSTISATTRTGLAIVRPDGSLEPGFAPVLSGAVYAIAVEPDARAIWAGGTFSMTTSSTSNLAKFRLDGSVDPAFTPALGNGVLCLLVQADGSLLVGGTFKFIGGQAQAHLARFMASGALDTTFKPVIDSQVSAMDLQDDGKIVIGGNFATVNGTARKGIARLNANGTLDPAPLPNVEGISSLALHPSGAITIGGTFTTVGSASRFLMARIEPDGNVNPDFGPNPNWVPSFLLPQADGALFVGGSFSRMYGLPSPSFVRMQPNGLLDSEFGMQLMGYQTGCAAVLHDGRVLVTGSDLTGANGVASPGIVRIGSPDESSGLRLAGPGDRIEWLRGGGHSPLRDVVGSLSTDAGVTWTPLGTGVRTAAGWEVSGLALPASGEVRLRGWVAGGDSTWQDEASLTFGSAMPRLEVCTAVGVSTPNGGATSFPPVLVSSGAASQTLTLRNTGTATLHFGGITVAGPHAADFRLNLGTLPPALPGGSAATLALAFTPTFPGPRDATLQIECDAPGANPFRIVLTGSGLPSAQADLASLSIPTLTLAPPFAANVTSYSATAAAAAESVTVLASAADPSATVTVNGSPTTAGGSLPVPVHPGDNIIRATVTAQDGVTRKDYLVTISRLAPQPFAADTDFLGRALSVLHPNPDLKCAVELPSHGIIVGGSVPFNLPSGTSFLAGFNADGSRSTSFAPPVLDNFVACVSVADQNEFMIGGGFTAANGLVRMSLAKLQHGETDLTFNAHLGYGVTATPVHLTGAAPCADGNWLLSGRFLTVEGLPMTGFSRATGTGPLDESFGAPLTNGYAVGALELASGKILLWGSFSAVRGVSPGYLVRLNPDGSLDATFNAQSSSAVNCVAEDRLGRLVVGGGFTAFAGVARWRLARLMADGTVDPTFSPAVNPGNLGSVQSLAIQADGTIVVGGGFATVGGVSAANFALIRDDGTIIPTPAAQTNAGISGVTVASDGGILLTGRMTAISGVVCNGLARVTNLPATQSLDVPSAARIEWRRGGSSPEATTVSFDLSGDGGYSWQPLGRGERMPGGWQISHLNLPRGGSIRARARLACGQYNASFGLVETVQSFTLRTPLETWRLTQFGSAENTGNAADLADPDHDNLPNLIEYALGLSPSIPNAGAVPQWRLGGAELILEFTEPPGISGIIYGAETSETMQAGTWTPLTDTASAPLHRFAIPLTASRRFARITISTP